MINASINVNSRHTSSFRWVIIALCYLTAVLVLAMPTTSLAVLFNEISADLNLTLVQIGAIWGMASFTGMFIALIGGMLGDKLGPNRVLTVACVMIGIFGATRGLATGFISFLVASFFLGLFVPAMGINLHRVASLWFDNKQLGLANGIIASGFATGFSLGAFLAGSFLSPLLGGWRNVLFFYGVFGIVIGLVWHFLYPKEAVAQSADNQIPLLQGLTKVLQYPQVLIIGVGKMGFWGGFRGFSGYLPIYLKDAGWTAELADNALAVFFIASLFGVIPLAYVSDKLGNRKLFMLMGTVALGTAVFGMGLTVGPFIWGLIILGGLFFDTFMSTTITKTSELRNLDPRLIGTALGVVFAMGDFAASLSPIIGNWLAQFGANVPFFFWGGIALLGMLAFLRIEAD